MDGVESKMDGDAGLIAAVGDLFANTTFDVAQRAKDGDVWKGIVAREKFMEFLIANPMRYPITSVRASYAYWIQTLCGLVPGWNNPLGGLVPGRTIWDEMKESDIIARYRSDFGILKRLANNGKESQWMYRFPSMNILRIQREMLQKMFASGGSRRVWFPIDLFKFENTFTENESELILNAISEGPRQCSRFKSRRSVAMDIVNILNGEKTDRENRRAERAAIAKLDSNILTCVLRKKFLSLGNEWVFHEEVLIPEHIIGMICDYVGYTTSMFDTVGALNSEFYWVTRKTIKQLTVRLCDILEIIPEIVFRNATSIRIDISTIVSACRGSMKTTFRDPLDLLNSEKAKWLAKKIFYRCRKLIAPSFVSFDLLIDEFRNRAISNGMKVLPLESISVTSEVLPSGVFHLVNTLIMSVSFLQNLRYISLRPEWFNCADSHTVLSLPSVYEFDLTVDFDLDQSLELTTLASVVSLPNAVDALLNVYTEDSIRWVPLDNYLGVIQTIAPMTSHLQFRATGRRQEQPIILNSELLIKSIAPKLKKLTILNPVSLDSKNVRALFGLTSFPLLSEVDMRGELIAGHVFRGDHKYQVLRTFYHLTSLFENDLEEMTMPALKTFTTVIEYSTPWRCGVLQSDPSGGVITKLSGIDSGVAYEKAVRGDFRDIFFWNLLCTYVLERGVGNLSMFFDKFSIKVLKFPRCNEFKLKNKTDSLDDFRFRVKMLRSNGFVLAEPESDAPKYSDSDGSIIIGYPHFPIGHPVGVTMKVTMK